MSPKDLFFSSYSLGLFSLSVTMSVSCVCVCVSAPSRKTLFPVNWRLLIDECIANRGIPLNIFCFYCFNDFCVFLNTFSGIFGSLQTSLLSIVGALAGGGLGLCLWALVKTDR